MKSAIVIGSTGLVGGYLISTLAKSKSFEKVIALVRRPYFEHYENVDEVVLNFNKEDLKLIDANAQKIISEFKDNIKEIWLTSQDNGCYGLDIKNMGRN